MRAHCRRVRVGHVPRRIGERQVLADLPAVDTIVLKVVVAQVDELAEDVGHRLVDCTRLVPIEQVRRELRHAVRELVSHHVVRVGEMVAVGHLAAVPECVLVLATGRRQVVPRAVLHRRDDPHAATVDAVPAEAVVVEVVGLAGEVVRLVDLCFGDRTSPSVRTTRILRAAGTCCLVAGRCPGRTRSESERGRDLVDGEHDATGDGVDQHELAQRVALRARDLGAPHVAGRLVAWSTDERRVIDPSLRSRGRQRAGGNAMALGRGGDSNGLGPSRGNGASSGGGSREVSPLMETRAPSVSTSTTSSPPSTGMPPLSCWNLTAVWPLPRAVLRCVRSWRAWSLMPKSAP